MQNYEYMKKIELEEKYERKRRFSFLISIVIGVTLLLAFLQLLLSNHLAGFGRELAAISKEEQSLTFENELLQKEIAKESSLATIIVKAHTLSLAAASNFLVVGEHESVALSNSNGF